jgi:alpha-glucosidase/alpha-D-xyloside xylohydrolase
MAERLSRRDALKQIGTASAGVVLAGGIIRGQTADIMVAGRPVEIAIASLSPSTVRISVLPLDGPGAGAVAGGPGAGGPGAGGRVGGVPVDGALVDENPGKSLGRHRTPGGFPSVKAGNVVVRFTNDPPTIHVETSSGQPVQKLTLDAKAAGMSFLLGSGPLLGLGQGGPGFDRKGQTDIMRNGQGGYRLRTHGARCPIQWLVGTDGWGMFIHHPLGSFDFTGAEGKFTPGVAGRPSAPSAQTFNDPPAAPVAATSLPLDVFIVASKDPAVIMGEYARITGHPELPALWTLGYMQSHRTLNGPEEINWVAKTFREKQLPCDALIYLGTEFTPSGWNTRNGEFGWKPENFPDPKGFIDAMHAQHLRVVLHIVIEGRRMSGSVKDPCDAAHQVPSGRTPDDKWPEDRPVQCYWPYHKPLYDLGIDGWWPDQGDGLDAPSRLARNRMYWEGSQLWRPNERSFALHRNGYAGMARFGSFLWSGDVFSTWETLKNHIPIAVNTGLSGIPYWGTDIGGFVPTAEYTGEMFVRWFQFGAFCPSFRSHGRTWHLHLPWGWNTGELGPNEVRPATPPPAAAGAGAAGGTGANAGAGGAGNRPAQPQSPDQLLVAANPDPSELHNAQVEPIVKQYLELRYRMLPYVYTAARDCHETGLPMMRALWLHYADDPAAVARGDQFLWGRDVLVAPVVEKGATSRKLYLPRGTWIDFWTEKKEAGGRELDRAVDLATTPLYVRAGAVMPMGPVKQYTDEAVDAPLTLVVYPGADGTSSVYEDDGKTFAHRKGDFMRVEMVWKDASRTLTVRLAKGSKLRGAAKRPIDVRLAGTEPSATKKIVFEGKPIDVKL